MLQIPATVLLIDVENVIGPFKPRLPMVRARVQALLAAAGPVEHTLACFSQQWPAKDSVISALIELGVAPWPVPPGPDAAEIALIGHARYLATRGGRWRFLVASGDHRLVAVAKYGELHVLVWDGHALASKLEAVATTVHRLAWPTPMSAAPPALKLPPTPDTGTPATADNRPRAGELAARATSALITGVGIAVGHRLLDALHPRQRSRRPHPSRSSAYKQQHWTTG